MASQTIFSPAKLNLYLAITGRRADGFHDLVSVVAPLDFGDTLAAEIAKPGAGARFTLTCDDPEVPADDTNLVLRAARAFAVATGWSGAAHFRLQKRIPMGAGLGGGSSNGAAALRALNDLAGQPLGPEALVPLAATLGSDCPLFLAGRPTIMRGRGERLDPLPADAVGRLRGRRVLVFKPSFSVPTAWAYRRLAEMAAATGAGGAGVNNRGSNGAIEPAYLPPAAAEEQVAAWLGDRTAAAEALLYNNLQRPVFEKYVALPTLLEQLRRDFALQPLMTGSGSACFTFLPEEAPVHEISGAIRHAWGVTAFLAEARVL